jgi:hypothetical protein
MNRSLLAVALVAISIPAFQAAAAADLPAGCGNDATQFKVKTHKGDVLASETAQPGKARIVFIQKIDGDGSGMPLTRFAVDGQWVGADRGQSAFVVDVAPGSHVVCASRQGSSQEEKSNVGSAKVDADAGGTAYVQFLISRVEIGTASQHAGGQALGYATPDMSSKPRDTTDIATLSRLYAADGAATAVKLPVSTFTQK